MIRPPLWPTPVPYAGTTLAPGPDWFAIGFLIAVFLVCLWTVGLGVLFALAYGRGPK